MKAVGYLKSLPIDQADSLMDIEIETPVATGRDILVKVAAVSVNPVDTKVRMRAEAEGDQHKILGWDAVGEVVAVGEDTELFKVGDQVWYAGDITRQGSNSEFQLVDERIVGTKPSSLSNEEAAAMPLTAITAYELLFARLDFTPGQTDADAEAGSPKPTILIMGAAGGVGSILTQLAKKLTNAIVIGTASRPESEQWVRDLGADHVINHHQPLVAQLNDLGIVNVTHVISLNHTEQHFPQLVEALAPQGKLALIDDPENGLDITLLKVKSLSLHWELMYTRSMFNTWDMQKQHDLLNQISQLIDDGVIKTTLGENYGTINAENLKRAHAHIETNQAVGKVVLEGF
ncbi:zinc-binding alcohol dehydrogenase family protein [Cocleimonas sp. KMM 6892]|uniref:zinc-binding alcohol dehydrogenase family protein n=1 Tax=unclassified Cocleimonas TaxID=2639732 RepID=UPI002DBCAEA6|nr:MULTISPECIES: zinc-binding alcohol dehydrogenase family protein [unclassified Cocleimonas]MEB8431785.1 zinc-binding alcohol dehydrogenase family protein [Cocleimonas sp. KMM 6892]MEC4715129.1 zinc-binding alcohol dehydrogenase family protein [Cocleimonas sp. KMM 6895]MEC4744057.1 zinc-binding alcohol dehydrogenase family protein [Cocleimonas sp. KMM 6896]